MVLAFLAANAPLRICNSRIEAADAATQRKFRAVLSQANAADAAVRFAAFDRIVPLGTDGSHLRVAPLPRDNNLFGCGPTAIVLIEAGKRKPIQEC